MVAEDVTMPIKLTICILSTILTGFVIAEIIYCLFNMCCINSKSTKNTKSTATPSLSTTNITRNSTAVGIVCYGLTIIGISIYLILVIQIEITRTEELFISFIILITYIIGRWCMLLLFVLRIDITFRGSIFEYPLIMIRILYIIIISFLFLTTFIIIFGYLPIGIDANLALSIRENGAFFWVLLDFILSCSLIILFLKKLFILFVREMQYNAAKEKSTASSNDMTQNMDDNEFSDDETENNHDHDHEAEMLIAMTRYTLLVIIAIISTLLAIALSLAINYSYWIFVILQIDAFINGLCLCLFNKFSFKIYNLICKYPHILCEHCCIDCIFCVHGCSNDIDAV